MRLLAAEASDRLAEQGKIASMIDLFKELKRKILTIVPSAEFTEPVYEFLNVIVLPADLRNLAEQLNSDPDLSFDYMFCLTGVDWVTHMMVVYHLYSTKNDHTVVMVIFSLSELMIQVIP